MEVSRFPVCVLLYLQSVTLSFGQLYLDPRVNPVNIQVINNLTNSEVTTITDADYVFLRYNTSGFGTTLYNIRACDDNLCSNYDVQLIDNSGCPVEFPGFGRVIPSGFVRDSVNSEIYQTQAFRAFRWDNGNSLYLTGQRDLCESSTAVCSDKCTASQGRRRRDLTPTRKAHQLSGSYIITGINGKECIINFNTDTGVSDDNIPTETDDLFRINSASKAIQGISIESTENPTSFLHSSSAYLFKTYLTDIHKCNDEVIQSMKILGLITFLTATIATILTILRALV